MPYATTLERFQNSILDAEAKTILPFLQEGIRCNTNTLFNIYIEGYRLRLSKVVENDYLCLGQYLGQEKMQAMIANYIENTPSRSYNLDHYPFGFWRYAQTVSEQPETRELAELEGILSEVFMLADSEALSLEIALTMDEETLNEAVFMPRTASRFLSFAHDVDLHYKAFKENKKIPIKKTPIHLLVVRHENQVKSHRLSDDEYCFLKMLNEGFSFGKAIDQHPHNQSVLQSIGAWLPKWIAVGFFTSIAVRKKDKQP